MRPEDRRSKAKSATRSRARMYLKAHLAFLPGYPTGQEGAAVRWTHVAADGFPDQTPVLLKAEDLRAARFGWNSLQRNFPRAVREAVDDFEAWRDVLPALLDRLSEAIHKRTALQGNRFTARFGFPASVAERANRLGRDCPRIGGVLDAASWIYSLRPDGAARLLSWLEDHAAHVHGVLGNLPGEEGVRLVLQLHALAAAEGVRRIEPLLVALGGCPDCFHVATCGNEYLEAWGKRLNHAVRFQTTPVTPLPERPPASWANRLQKFARWLSGQTSKVRRRALDYFQAAVPADLLPRWRDWWSELDREASPARHLLDRIAASNRKHILRAFVFDLRQCAKRIAAFRARMPPSTAVPNEQHWCGRRRILDVIESLAQRDFEPLHRTLASLLAGQKMEAGGVLRRAAVLEKIDRWAIFYRAERFVPLVRLLMSHGLAGHIAGSRSPELESLDTLVDCAPALQQRCCKALAYWLLELKQSDLDWPLALPCAVEDDADVREYLRSVTADGAPPRGAYNSIILCAAQIAPGPAEFRSLVDAVARMAEKDYNAVESVAAVWECLRQGGWGHLAAEAVLAREFKRIGQLAAEVRLARRLGTDPQPPAALQLAEAPAWAAGYPESLRRSIARLESIVPQCQVMVAGVLGEAFRGAASLEEELRYLDARLEIEPDNVKMRRRRDNLRTRMRTPLALAPARWEHLDQRLRQAVRRVLFDRWHAALRADTAPRLCRLLETDQPPPWLAEPRHQESLAGVLELRGWARQLGLRLLKMRCGPPPWSLSDEPANRAFVDRLARIGVDLGPWLSPPAPQPRRAANSRNVRLCFEADPLEILQMGAYFGTCLSPGSVNFFSTVANAVDVNKHVVYARDGAGQVVGRCLIAIADNGGLIPFNAYCHDPELGFDKLVADVLHDLAARMKTVVVREGRVAALVAGDWYDDGPIDLCGRFPCLEENSPLRQALPVAGLSELPAQLDAAFSPMPLNMLLLSRLIALPEFDQRPELVLPLLPRFERQPGLSLGDAMRVAELTHAAGRVEEARRVAHTLVAPVLGRAYLYSLQDRYLKIAKIAPSLLLRFVRRTRASGIDHDLRENDWPRLQTLAEVHDALGRGKKAEAIRKRMEAVHEM